jgi:hypothetical protein
MFKENMSRHAPTITVPSPRQSMALLWLCLVVGAVSSCPAEVLLAHWSLDESGSPYSDSSGNQTSLIQDAATTVAIAGPGIAGGAAQLNWQAVPGTSTRLSSTNNLLQSDSFGFSFWINPNYLNPGDNFIAKEMPYTTTVAGDQRMAWQVRVSTNNIAGSSPLELIVRGNNPTNGNFYGNVLSATNIPLFTSMTSWIHVAGGYDTGSGALILFVNGQESDSINSLPGSQSSDGSPFDVGTGRNGSDFVVFAAGSSIDDLQLYNGPVSPSDVSFLMANPGQDIRPFYITQMTYDPSSGSVTASVISTNYATMTYVTQVSTNLGGFVPVTNTIPVSQSSTVTLPKQVLDGLFGSSPRSSLFLNMYMLTIFAGCN